MSEPSADTVPERILLQARSDYLGGFNRLLGLARRELRIFDPDLSELEMNSTSRIETLTRFLRESRTHRIYVALHDIEHVTKRCPRLIALMSSYTSALLIFQTHGEAAKVPDCFVLADGDHLVRRPVRTQARGVLVINDPKECQPMRERFEEIWEASLPTVSVNTTGL
jgi:ABC-type cobalamin/Fe3+-siderophores transport system ATPase subunit